MPRVNVDQTALTDYRVKLLAHLLDAKLPTALGYLVLVWNTCLDRETYTLAARDLHIITEIEGFAALLVEADLGRQQDDGRIYIRGTKGRIEWVQKARENGRHHAKRSIPSKQGGVPSGVPSGGSSAIPNGCPGEEAFPLPHGQGQAVPAAMPGGSESGHDLETLPAPAPTSTLKEVSQNLESSTSQPKTVGTVKVARSKRVPKSFDDDSKEIQAARYLFERIRRNDEGAREPNWQSWALHFYRLFHIDKRDPKEATRLIDFATTDPFWRANVLSAESFRDKYSRLKIQASQSVGRVAPRAAGHHNPTGVVL